MAPKKLSKEVVEMLNERINDEYGHHYFYRQFANYCENAGYIKAAAYFHEEAEEEQGHARMIQKYLTDWNVTPTLMPIEPPPVVKSLVDGIEKAYEKEYDLYTKYEKISADIFDGGDISAFDFLMKFRTIQTEALATYSTLLNKLELIDKTDKNWVYQFEQTSF